MSLIERDNHSGYTTTGHEWNGIKELNTPIPRIVLICLAGTFLFAVTYWYLMPSWPLGDRFYPGKLGIDQRTTLAEQTREADKLQRSWIQSVEAADFEAIYFDNALMAAVNDSGARLFEDNCSMCHGRLGVGNLSYPSLADESWLWGDDPTVIYETLRVGINSEHPESRNAIMPAFGQMGVLDAGTIDDVVTYVRTEARLPVLRTRDASKRLKAGQATYKLACSGCHGTDLKGNQSIGTPNLVDRYWLYGSDKDSVFESIWSGRQGHMPSWEARLEPYERKLLAVYTTTLD